MTKPVTNEVNIVSKGRSVVDVDDNGSVNKHGRARPKNQEVSLVTVIQKLDTVLFELANLKTQLAQKADKADLDALEDRVHLLGCWNENKAGMDGPRVDTKGDGSSLVQIVRDETKLNLVVRGLAVPSPSETTGNINTNDDDTQAVAPYDTAYKRCISHSGHKLLCKLCRTFPPPAMGARFPIFWACRMDPLDGCRCCSQKRVMSRPIQVRQL